MENKKEIERLKKFFHNNTCKDRQYYDSLIRTIWCEIRLPLGHPARSRGDEWADILEPSYTKGTDDYWPSSREMLSKRTIATLTEWMNTRTAMYDMRRGRELMHELFDDCQLVALNIIS